MLFNTCFHSISNIFNNYSDSTNSVSLSNNSQSSLNEIRISNNNKTNSILKSLYESDLKIICCFAILSLFINFIPLIHHRTNIYILQNSNNFNSDEQYESLLQILIFLCIPIIIEWLLDYLYTPLETNNKNDTMIIHNYKCIVTFGMMLPNVIIYTLSLKNSDILLIQIMFNVQVYIVTLATIFLMNYYDNEIWTNKLATFGIILCSMRVIIVPIWFIIHSMFIRLIWVIVLISSALLWIPLFIKLIIKHYKLVYNYFMNTITEKNVNNRLLSIFYIVVLAFLGWYIHLINIWTNDMLTRFKAITIGQIIVVGFIALIPGRLARMSAVQSDVIYIYIYILTI